MKSVDEKKATRNKYQREYYLRNKAHLKVELKEAHLARYAFYYEAKQQPCTDCKKVYHPCAMDFDHVRGAKVAGLSWMVRRNRPAELIKEEMAKCELVCANCHRLRTFIRSKGK